MDKLNITLPKNEVLKIKDDKYAAFYCINDICIPFDHTYQSNYLKYFDENNTYKKYITCSFKFINTGICDHISCFNDSECLSNMYYNNTCVYNNKTILSQCDSIYSCDTFSLNGHAFMHCGKSYGDLCDNDNECSSYQCNQMGYCEYFDSSSYDTGASTLVILYIFLFIISIVFIISTMICFVCCIHKIVKIKENKYKKK